MKPSRAMIPGEVLCALYALALAWSGGLSWPLSPGPLYYLLAKTDQNITWLTLFGTPAIFLIYLSLREWVTGQNWNDRRLSASCCWRGKAVALMGLCWLYGVHLLGSLAWGANALILQAMFAAMYCGWSYLENRRVRRELRKKYARS